MNAGPVTSAGTVGALLVLHSRLTMAGSTVTNALYTICKVHAFHNFAERKYTHMHNFMDTRNLSCKH